VGRRRPWPSPNFLRPKSDGPISGFAKNGDAPVRGLLQALVDQPLQILVLVAVNIAPKGPLAHPEQPGRLLLSQVACLPSPDASSNLIFRISCSKFVRLIGHLLGVQWNQTHYRLQVRTVYLLSTQPSGVQLKPWLFAASIKNMCYLR